MCFNLFRNIYQKILQKKASYSDMESPRGNNTTRICQERELKEISERFIDSIFLNLTVSCYGPLTKI